MILCSVQVWIYWGKGVCEKEPVACGFVLLGVKCMLTHCVIVVHV